MKVLFVASGNSKSVDNISPFIRSQGDSLRQAGIEIQYYPLHGKGISGYIKSALRLRRHLQQNHVDIVHAHYTLSGWSAVLAFPVQPIVLSLMGTDAYGAYTGVNKIKLSSRYLTYLTYLIQPFVRAIICKSKNIEQFVYVKKKNRIIPNGIRLDDVVTHENGFREVLGLCADKKYVLFLGNKENRRKNFRLAKKAVDIVGSDDVHIVAPYPVPHEKVVQYLNSADVTIVPSLMEGSPNVVKEAMACNCPVVATDVGDVAWLFGNEPGHFLTSFEPRDVADKIRAALDFSATHGRTNGRERIIELGLDAKSIANRLIEVYQSVLQN